MTILKVSASPHLPLDPVKIQTMADYDLALCLTRTWFEFDQARQAMPGIISEWKFDSKAGAYTFVISKNSKWSDGSPIITDDLVKNLERVVKNKSSYGVAIDAIIDLKGIKKIDDKNFIIPTKNKQPSFSFFQRMGSSALALIHPKDLDKDGNVISNHFSSGPYRVVEKSATDLILNANEYDIIANSKRPPVIHIRFTNVAPDVDSFIDGTSFEDIIQTHTLMPNEVYAKIVALKFPIWTRAYDRVSYIGPVKSYSKNPEKLRDFVKGLGKLFQEESEKLELPKNVKVARSLQPKGYPLNEQITYSANASQLADLPKAISILTVDGYQYKIQRKIIESLVSKLNPSIKLTWVVKATTADYLKELSDNCPYDLKLISFGVADPEASTWLSLVLNPKGPFVEISEKDTAAFEGIIKSHSPHDKEVADLRKLITSIGERGSYLPLFHFSTMSIGKPGINFENINELDETIDYSKLIVK